MYGHAIRYICGKFIGKYVSRQKKYSELVIEFSEMFSRYLPANNRNTRTRCKICLKLTIKAQERSQWHRSDIFTVNFEHISHLFLVFLLLTLDI